MSARGKFIAIIAAIALILAVAVIYSDYKEEQKAEYYENLETEQTISEKETEEDESEPTTYELKEAVEDKLSGRAFGAETDAGYIVYSFGPYGIQMSCYQDSSSDSLLIAADSGKYTLSDDLSQITIRLIAGGNETYDFEILKKSIKLDGYKFKETDRIAED